jgi:hypothetical protein
MKKLILKHYAEDAYNYVQDAHPFTKVEWWGCWLSGEEGPTGYGDTPGAARADLERQLRAGE